MKPMLEFDSDAGSILIQAADTDHALVNPTGRLDESIIKLKEKLEEKIEVLSQLAASAVGVVKDKITNAESIELEFGVAFTMKGNIFVVESSAEATFKFKLTTKP